LIPIEQIVQATQHFSEGDWQTRAAINRKDEIGLLAYSFNNMADQLSKMYRSMEIEVEERTQQVFTASEIAHLSTSSTSLDELLNQAVNLIIERFGYYHSAIFLVDEAQENAVLREASGTEARSLKSQNFRIPLSSESIVGWVARNNKPWIASDIAEDKLHLKHELLPETHSEVGLPIAIGSTVLGILDVQSTNPNAFTPDSVDVLYTLANQLASAIQNFRLLEGTTIDLNILTQLYRASRRITQATSQEDVFQTLNNAIQQTSFISALYVPYLETLQLVENHDSEIYYSNDLPKTLNIPASIAENYLPANTPLIIRDVMQPIAAIHAELLLVPQRLNCQSSALLPIHQDGNLIGLIIISSREQGLINQTTIQPFSNIVELSSTALEKIRALKNTQHSLHELQIVNNFSNAIGSERELENLFPLVHTEILKLFGELEFYIALYDPNTQHIEIPYMYEQGEIMHIDPFPLGEGLTSIVIRTKQPLMLVENTEQRSRALGAKVVGNFAKSWLGVPLSAAGEVIGVMTIQDLEQEHRFDEADLRILLTLSTQIAGVIHNLRLLEESKQRSIQLQTAAEIARDTSGTLERDVLLQKAINLVRDRFNFYHASVFLLDTAGEYAVVQESTGEAGRKMMEDGHKLKVGSQSIIGFVTENAEPLVVNDVTQDPTHRFNPLLPDTRAELGIPLTLGSRVLGALDVQSTQPYAFSPEDISVLRILADQLAVAVANADLFSETQEHLAQHRLIHHVTTVAASSANLEEALSSAVQGLRVTLGDRVSILMLDSQRGQLRIIAQAGYEDSIRGIRIEVGQGITGWVAEHKEPIIVNDVRNDPRYISGSESVLSELAVPLLYRGELLGILNVESDEVNAFNDHDQDILGTLAGSLSAIIVNTRLAERQRQLFEVTNKIRRSSSIENILETTANELSKVMRARKARVQIGGGQTHSEPTTTNGNGSTVSQDEEQEGAA
ncbi:MAG: GAF domain-containing protein, partial [Anaerolineae bacterium]|nr:GAF domain-containing protein [Anaerolineae bacterium]